MGSQKGSNKGTGSIRESGMVRESTNKVGPAGSGKKNKQGFNKKGTAYGGSLAAAMAKANAAKPGASSLDKTMTRRPGAFSPQDVAAAAGRLAATREMENQFGSRNLARASFADLIGQQQDRLNNAIGGPRFRDELGQVRTAPNTFAQRVFNEATGVNPTTGMGIMDSLRSNYAMSQGIPGSGLFGAGLSLAAGIPGLGILANPIVERFFPSEEDDEGLNKFGLPDYSPRRTINEYTTESTFSPTIEDESPSLSFNDDAFAAALDNPLAMRQMLPKNLNLSNQLRLSNLNPRLSLTNTNPRLSLLTNNQLRLSAPQPNPYSFQNPNMLNQKLSKYGTVGNTSLQTATAKASPSMFSKFAGPLARSLGFLGSLPAAAAMLTLSPTELGASDFPIDPDTGLPDYSGATLYNKGGSVSPQRGPMSSGIGTLYKLK